MSVGVQNLFLDSCAPCNPLGLHCPLLYLLAGWQVDMVG